MIDHIRKLLASESGATAVEYGLILALIAIAAMSGMIYLADTTTGMWNGVAANVLAQ